MSLQRIAIPVLIVLAGVLLMSAPSIGQDTKPDIRGMVKSINVSKDTTQATILIEGPKGQTYDKASVRLTKDTKVLKLVGKERKAATADDLKVGIYVEAKFVGPVAESYPVQARAGEILIIGEAKK